MTVSNHLTFKTLLLAATILASPLILAAPSPAAAQSEIALSVQLAPPLLPVYAQPPMPEDGYIWTPGYWHWSQQAGYYWVPGTWILPPTAGMLWTPPYWAWLDGAYLFHAGYWGPNVGYYGGVNYGYGYGGSGYQGGRWEGGNFVYNRSVNNFGRVAVAHVYQQNVTSSGSSRVSYAGGKARPATEPTAAEHAAEHDTHVPVTAEQTKHIAAAAKTPVLAASHNHGTPAIAATSRPAQFKGPGVVHTQPGRAAQRAALHPSAGAHPAAAARARPAPAHVAAAAQHAAPHPTAAAHPAARPAPAHVAAAAPHAAAANDKEEKR